MGAARLLSHTAGAARLPEDAAGAARLPERTAGVARPQGPGCAARPAGGTARA